MLKTPRRRHPGLQQRARGPERRPRLQHRRRLPAAVGRARRRGRADPRQPGAEEDRHRHREDRGARRARDPRHGAGRTASTSSAATASAWPTRGTACASAARSAATTPTRSLLKGSVAIFSNSGGFTTTIAQYLATEGWGTTTLVSSGKDVYIHYARARLRACAAQRRPLARRGAVCRARRLLRARRRLRQAGGRLRRRALEVQADPRRRPCRRDGRLRRQRRGQGSAGSCEAFGVDAIFTPENPVVSTKGAVVTNIAHIPAALTAVMAAERRRARLRAARQPGAEALDRQRPGPARCRPTLALPPVTAPEPYAAQIATLGRQVGAVIARQNMKDKSGASVMDPKTQVTSCTATPCSTWRCSRCRPTSRCRWCTRSPAPNDRAMLDIAVAGRGQPGRRPDPGRRRGGARGRQLAEHGDGGGGARSSGRSASSGRWPARGR